MDKCGVAWFKMNESAGNLMDSKGSFVGVNNSTSVVSGFSGNGRSFNGTSSYISFPSGMIPLGRKSVRFKIKLSTEGINNYSWILSSGHNGESSFNILLDFRSASKGIRFTLRDASGTTGEIYTIVTNYFVDNQWHDYLFTWDGTTNVNGVKVYCDGIISSTETAKKNETAIINKPLILGNIPALGSAEYFNGQLDELEIYNDVIHPFASKILLSSGDKYYSKVKQINDKSSVPTMNSNVSPSGIASASSIYSVSYEPWRVFNGVNISNLDCWITNNVKTGWLMYKFEKSKQIVKYSITSRNDASFRGDLKRWTFEGSADGVVWDVLDNRINEREWIQNESRSYYILDYEKAYLYYRINVIETHAVGNAAYITIGMLSFYEHMSDVMLKLSDDSEGNFMKYGLDGKIKFFSETVEKYSSISSSDSLLSSGKTFEHLIDMSKRRVDKITLG